MKKLGTKRIVFAILFALILVAGPAATRIDAAPISIGSINPLTGKLASHGREILLGIQAAVDEINAAGGLAGNRVVLHSRDDQSRPEVAVGQAEDLIVRRKVTALVGGYVDSLVGPLSQLALRHHIPYVASASLQTHLSREDNPYFFRISHLRGLSEPLCGFVTQALGARSAALFHAATPGATELAGELFRCLQEAGVTVTVVEKFRPGVPDFSPLVLKLKPSPPDVLIAATFFQDHLILARQIRELGVPIKAYIGPWGVSYPTFVQEMGKAAEDLFGLCAWKPGMALPGTEEASEAFTRWFREKYKREPTSTVMHGYTSARALLDAMARVVGAGKPLTGPEIARALRTTDLLLPMERVAFDAKGDPLYYRQTVVQIQNGALVPVYPAERAQGSWVYPMSLSIQP
ncbi:branched-chain amino acid transport system substrate-binding protein [Desulfacinum hydrothermale DSM 13146]|uniref:Branched-chain amino acid transport system substrate-binding protein n=1 Tax=Desulfacinum hydrothermale DSM 13146 TaxID=1121390 RepID=A0A1W1XRY3_9BACT|nr:ABC transporter substrate-binding protein [Desulfacinum hydrothermale]SMC26615.1 branched-chain amino acid transport system substrate-binding protein [Desulfacinum hydrothermale DSM 13146]